MAGRRSPRARRSAPDAVSRHHTEALPLVWDLQQRFEAEGLRAPIREVSLGLRFLSHTIDNFDIEVAFEPCDATSAFWMHPAEWVVSKLLPHGCWPIWTLRALSRVMGQLENAILFSMGPRGASTRNSVGEPPGGSRS